MQQHNGAGPDEREELQQRINRLMGQLAGARGDKAKAKDLRREIRRAENKLYSLEHD